MLTPNLITTASAAVPNDPTQLFIAAGSMDQTITIEPGTTGWPIGSMLTIVKRGSAWLTIKADGNADVRGNPSLRFKAPDLVIQFLNVGLDTWVPASGNAVPAGI